MAPPTRQGLYDPRNEHDSCGMGFVAHVKGERSNAIIRQGLKILANLDHRGGVGADPSMGDGAGCLIQIPDALFRDWADSNRLSLPPAGDYAVAMCFLPRDEQARERAVSRLEHFVRIEGQVLVGWYDDSLGTEGKTLQLYVERDGDEAKNHIFGSGAFDTIKGFGGSDMLKGGGGDDTINGGDGKDSINGQLGSDLLIGGAGKDLFQFSDIADVRYGDTIQDLDAKDRINLAGIDADINTAGNQSFTIVSAFTGAAGQLTIDYNVTHAGMTTIQMDVDGDGLSDGSIMIVGDHTGFTNYVL